MVSQACTRFEASHSSDAEGMRLCHGPVRSDCSAIIFRVKILDCPPLKMKTLRCWGAAAPVTVSDPRRLASLRASLLVTVSLLDWCTAARE
jgi:hypothetical protein